MLVRRPGPSMCVRTVPPGWSRGADRRTSALPTRQLRFLYVMCRGGLRCGQLHGDAEPPAGPGAETEGSVVRLGDALDDGQAESDACVVGVYPFGYRAETARQGWRPSAG